MLEVKIITSHYTCLGFEHSKITSASMTLKKWGFVIRAYLTGESLAHGNQSDASLFVFHVDAAANGKGISWWNEKKRHQRQLTNKNENPYRAGFCFWIETRWKHETGSRFAGGTYAIYVLRIHA